MGHSRETFSFTVGEYKCVASALSIGEYDSLVEGAFSFSPFFSCEAKEEVIFSCLQEPAELIDAIKEGSIVYGIPNFVFETIMINSGFDISPDDREAILNENRETSNNDVISSCKAMILASGIMSLDELDNLTVRQLFRNVALAEQVLFINQQNVMAAFIAANPAYEGPPTNLKLTWDEQDEESSLVRQMAQKQEEVHALLEQQTAGRMGRGVRRL